MTSATGEWRQNRHLALMYDASVKRNRVARVLGTLMWGTDIAYLDESIEALGKLAEGNAVLDVPCGGGLAFRALRSAGPRRYVAVDISPEMLDRAHAEAERRQLDSIEFVSGDVHALPLEDQTFDLCISYNSLHCFADPQGALGEMARVLSPGGMLRGSTCISGVGRRQDALISAYQRRSFFGEVGEPADVERWLTDSGFEEVDLHLSGAVAYFSCKRA